MISPRNQTVLDTLSCMSDAPLDLEAFTDAIARRLQAEGNLSSRAARDAAEEIVFDYEEPELTTRVANALARDEIRDWESGS